MSWKQEDCDFEASLGCIVILYLKKANSPPPKKNRKRSSNFIVYALSTKETLIEEGAL
jgi:hypothetical protein